jgi:hypothetical protein
MKTFQRTPNREPPIRTPRQSRLAVTVPAPILWYGGSSSESEDDADWESRYPQADEQPNTYWIVFVDASYDAQAGYTSAQLTYRQFANRARTLARNTVEGMYLEPFTLIEVTFYEGQWWFTRGDGGESPYGSQGSGSDADSDSGGGSEKDTAIVRASWTAGGYTAMATEESDRVYFNHVVEVSLEGIRAEVPIDPRHLELCERGTFHAIGPATDRPVAVAAFVRDERLHVELADGLRPTKVTVLLKAIRRTFLDWQFPDMTREEFEANERFLKSRLPK